LDLIVVIIVVFVFVIVVVCAAAAHYIERLLSHVSNGEGVKMKRKL
jgi:hypothetical protein